LIHYTRKKREAEESQKEKRDNLTWALRKLKAERKLEEERRLKAKLESELVL
jgi:hypothetical protein